MISASEARELFSYDPDTGVLSRLTGQKLGPVSVSPRSDGYLSIAVGGRGGKRLYLHRLAWLIATGESPEVIDHIDGNRANNRLSNLRAVTPGDNTRNAGVRKDNRSGVTGVHLHGDGKKWAAQIKSVPGKTVHLGLFSTVAEAAAAIEAARVQYGYHPNHGRRSAHEGPTYSDGAA